MENIIITKDVAHDLNKCLDQKSYSRTAILVDENTFEHCYPKVEPILPEHQVIEIKSGEINKNIDTCVLIWDALTKYRADRNSVLINLGGGVIGDMGGFCASTYKRGIDFINIPTTLLAQVDANIGGKLGIDFNSYKNHIGLFKDPEKVIIDTQFLSTLPENELKSGFAEVIKHHLISDHKGWDALKTKSWGSFDWNKIVSHSARIKHDIVTRDPTEKGLRKILNFGHTVGHAVESYLLDNNRGILHGQAVALGMICEAQIAFNKNLISLDNFHEIENFIRNIYEKIDLTQKDAEIIIEYAHQDKKNKDNTILAALLERIGSTKWDVIINREDILGSLQYYRQM